MKYTTYIPAGLVVLAVFMLLLVYTFAGAPAPLNPQQAADTSLGQYVEQPNAAPAQTGVAAPAPANTPLVKGCSLHFSFAPVSKVVAPGGTINYRVTLSNQGTDTCTNVSFSVYYSDDEAYASAAPRATAGNYYWSVGALASAKTYAATLSTTEQGGGSAPQLSNEGCATADNSKDVCADNVIFVQTGAASAAGVPPQPAPAADAGVWGAVFDRREFGTWIWDSPVSMAPGYGANAIAAAQQNGFNTVYLTIDDYLDIAALPAGTAKDAQTAAYMRALDSFIALAKQKGIAVDVEGGAKDWAEPLNRWKGYALIDFVAAYNRAYPQAIIHGLQYDVEAYLLPQYDNDQGGVLGDYIAFIDASAARMRAVNAQFSVVVPHFYDSQQQWTPAFSYGGKTAYAFTHLLDVLQQKPNSELIVMAYRNFFAGDNGTHQISQAEVQEAATNGYTTKVIVAQETGNVTPSYVTFSGLPKARLFIALTDISAAYQSSPSFGGVAVHYLDPFLVLK